MSDNRNLPEAPTRDRFFSMDMFANSAISEQYAAAGRMLGRHLKMDALAGRTIMDLGCGHGGYGRLFVNSGARLVFVDGRQENLAAVRAAVPGAVTYRVNIEDDEFPADIGKIDVVLCMGLVYHVRDPKVVFQRIARITDHVFVETSCLDHDGVMIVNFLESSVPNHFSVTGNACRPSPKWVEQALRESGFPRVLDISHRDGNVEARPGLPGQLFDWEYGRTCGWRRNECSLRRMFMASRDPSADFLAW